MVNKIVRNGKEYHVCKECGLAYEDKKTAEKCQKWCKKYHSCNLELIKNAIKIK